MMKENKKKYLTPKVKVVAFMVENGFEASKLTTEAPAASTYEDVDQSWANDWN